MTTLPTYADMLASFLESLERRREALYNHPSIGIEEMINLAHEDSRFLCATLRLVLEKLAEQEGKQ